MKRFIAAILLASAFALSANFIVYYNPTSSIVTNRVTGWLESVNPDAADGRDDAQVIDTLPVGIAAGTWKWDGADFVPLTTEDNDAIAATNALNAFLAQEAFTNAVRLAASNAIQDRFNEQDLLIRALALAILDEFNNLRALHALGPRTKQQLRNAVQGYINDGSADSNE